ncbi:DUF354 domain-containing protein [Haloterrigena alkaliphila]|uniref:DUF354 domain-containing protein n=1 Tax=Haloterrigena alkaliphila TaxID=2816475 RepID=A0A8A2VBM5_9EURY|nr:DUF354 domain-containing protein [Haloterrigena alkaliphila]QSW99423.1 DUF354 domain-containing protein [Haloterrigena alkaliphila]
MTERDRVLITIQHPAHVHFFRNAVADLEDRGYDVHVYARDKDVTCDLLEAYDMEYEVLAGSAESTVELAKVQAVYEYRILKRARELSPDALLAIGEPAVAHASTVVDGHSVLFTDTEHATFQNAITFPFADLVCTPRAFRDDLGDGHYAYSGYHELAYLHPDRFTPDPRVLAEIGARPAAPAAPRADGGVSTDFGPSADSGSGTNSGAGSGAATRTGTAPNATTDDPLVVLRLVSWNAAHDFGRDGMNDIERLVAELERFGATVRLSAEGELPPALADRRFDLPPERMHDLLAHADLFLGESATMAIESAVLGTPSLYVSDLDAGVLEELETRYGLLRRLPQETGTAAVADAARELLATDDSTWERRRRRLLEESVDTTSFVVDTVERVVRG